MINPVLTEMAVYPFTRLEEERRRLLAAGVEVIDFGKGDPNEPTDPMIRRALVDALPERAPYPSPRVCPSCARPLPAGSNGGSALRSTPEREIVPTYGSKEAIFSLAQVLGTDGHVVAFGEPSYPVYERGALFAGAEVRMLPLRTGERLSAGSRRAGRRRRARLGQLPAQPDRRGRATRVLRRARGGGRALRLRGRLRRGLHGALVRRAAGVRAAGRRPLALRRLPDAEQAIVDDRLPLRFRRRTAGDRGCAQGVPPDGRDGAAGVRAAGFGRRVERRAARRGDSGALSREAGRADPGDRETRLGDRRERGDDVPVGGGARSGCVARQWADRVPRRDVRAERRGLRPLRARPHARGVRAGSGDLAGGGRDGRRRNDRGARPGRDPRRGEDRRRLAGQRGGERQRSSSTSGCGRSSRSRSGRSSTSTRSRSSATTPSAGVRVVPPATARYGSFLSPGRRS